MNVNRYQFDTIIQKTKKSISCIQQGEEDFYFVYLNCLESTLLQLHKQYHINGRQTQEILQIVLFDIKSFLEKETYDCLKWYENCYCDCVEQIEALFFPEKNPTLKKYLENPENLDSSYFELPQKCIVRVYASIENWTKESGEYGYFNYISNFIMDNKSRKQSFLVESRFLKQKLPEFHPRSIFSFLKK